MTASTAMPILIVDDYNTMIRIVRNLLRQIGFTNIEEANGGAAALAKLRSKDYALVISDTRMTSMSGSELLRRMRAEERTRFTPFVAMANDAAEGQEMQCRDAADYIIKPFSAQTLRDKLEPVLGAPR